MAILKFGMIHNHLFFEVDGNVLRDGVNSRPQVVPPKSQAFGVSPQLHVGEWLKLHNGHLCITYRYGRSKQAMNMLLFVDYEFEVQQHMQPDGEVATGFAHRIHDMRYMRVEIKSEIID